MRSTTLLLPMLLTVSAATHAQVRVTRPVPLPPAPPRATFTVKAVGPRVDWPGPSPESVRSVFAVDVVREHAPRDLPLSLIAMVTPPEMLRFTTTEPTPRLKIPATAWERGCAPVSVKARLAPADPRVDSDVRTVTVTPRCSFSLRVESPGASVSGELVKPVCGGPIQIKLKYAPREGNGIIGLRAGKLAEYDVEEKSETGTRDRYRATLVTVGATFTPFPSLVTPKEPGETTITVNPVEQTLGAVPPAMKSLAKWAAEEWNNPEASVDDDYTLSMTATSKLSSAAQTVFLSVRRSCTFDAAVTR